MNEAHILVLVKSLYEDSVEKLGHLEASTIFLLLSTLMIVHCMIAICYTL